MKQQVKISKVKGNPKNPRIIKNDKFKTLKHSIKTLPNYMKLRPVIVDEEMMVLGGNMRLKASIDLGKKEIWTDMFTQADCDEMNEIAIEEDRETKTYLEYCDEIIIKDNVSSGDWEWDMLANEWDSVQLNEFGIDVWQNEDDIDTRDEFSLPDGEKGNLEQITYTLSSEQCAIIKEAVQEIKNTEEYKYVETYGNENSNGNALYLLISEWKKTNS
tara:strand:- start:48 stop:695 length:648 start_codon:yes stop_codon:yes gene_type:complete